MSKMWSEKSLDIHMRYKRYFLPLMMWMRRKLKHEKVTWLINILNKELGYEFYIIFILGYKFKITSNTFIFRCWWPGTWKIFNGIDVQYTLNSKDFVSRKFTFKFPIHKYLIYDPLFVPLPCWCASSLLVKI